MSSTATLTQSNAVLEPSIAVVSPPPPVVASTVLHRIVGQQPQKVVRAKGCYLYTSDGKRFLDGCGGAAVVSIGHGDERVNAAMIEQLGRVAYLHSGLWTNEPAEELANLLTDNGKTFTRALFNCGGSEAAESAIKLCRQYHIENGQPQRVHFIARDQSYHGNSLGALSLCRHVARRKPYIPILQTTNFHSVTPAYAYRYSYNGESTAEFVKRLADELETKILELGSDKVAAFACETVTGATTGCVPPPAGYLTAMKTVCEKYGVLFVLDEIMCGVGRTGKMHAWQWEGEAAKPDVQTCGKGLGGGYAAISAVLVGDKVVNVLRKGSGAFNNGYTYQSHAVGCRAAIEVLKIMKLDQLIDQCHARGQYLLESLRTRLGAHRHVGDIRGMGLFIALEFVSSTSTRAPFALSLAFGYAVTSACFDRGLIVYPGAGTIDGDKGDHLIIAPPYIITEEQCDWIVETLAEAVEECSRNVA